MPSVIVRKDLSFGEGATTIKEWKTEDLEVSLIKKKDIFSVAVFAVYPNDFEGLPTGGSSDVLIEIGTFDTEDLNEAEEEFNAYASNFI